MSQGTTSEVWTIGRLLQWTTGWLQQHQVDQPRLSAELLIAHALQCRKIELYTRFDVAATPDQLAAMRELVRQAAEHMPIAYLIGRKEFYSLEFEVTPAVLIPRPETETLVQKTIDLCRAAAAPMRILDLGTGSGCIAVGIARYVPPASLVAADISPEAIDVARRNADRHGVTDRVRFFTADWLDLPADAVPPDGFDIIVSNPPYIPEADMASLPRNVRDYEPRHALTAPGSDGLVFYRRLAADCGRHLRPGGDVLVEIGHDQHAAVREILSGNGVLEYVGTYRDPTDPHDRVVHARHRSV